MGHHLSHRNFVKFHHSHENAQFVFIATEFCVRGDLFRRLRLTTTGFPERRATSFLRQVLSVLHYMHKSGFAHRDVKLENILLAQDGCVKLADLGTMYWRTGDGDGFSTRVCGSPQYAAPEVMRKSGYVPQRADLWSCGITLFVLLTRCMPFDPNWWYAVQGAVKQLHVDRALQHERLGNLSLAGQALLVGLLTVDPRKRISTAEATRLCDASVELDDRAVRDRRRMSRPGHGQ